MKRERIEDLGVITERLRSLVDNLGRWDDWVNSKHGFDAFLQHYSNEETMHELHRNLMCLKDGLYEILVIARGDEE